MTFLHRGALAVATLLALAPSAHAANRFTLDAHPDKPARVLLNPPGSAPGSALVAWTSAAPSDDLAPIPKVCVIAPGLACSNPQTLHAPEGDGAGEAIDGLFPVVSGSTVTLVGPRDAQEDVITWSSVNGAPFGPPSRIRGVYNAMTGPQDVLNAGASTLIGTVNPGLGFSSFGAARGAFEFLDAGPDVKDSSLALDRLGRPVQAYFELGESPNAGDSKVRFYRRTGAGSIDDRANWSGPTDVTTGDEPVLTGGASGLFLVDVDTPAGSDRPTLLNIRRDDDTTFSTPQTLSDDPGAELFDGGAATQSPSGRIAVLWPQTRTGDGLKVMRLFTSTDRGASFAQTDVATMGDSYLSDRNASAAVGDDGQGIVTFVDDGGLEVADLTPIAAYVPPAPVQSPLPVSVPSPAMPPVVFDPARGPFARTSANVGPDVVTLQTPKGCVRSGDVVMRLSVRSRKRKGHVVVKIRRVQFRLDGRLMRTKTHPVFSARFHVNVTPGSRHVLTARAFIKIHHGPKRSKTLRNTFTACAS